LGFLLLGILTWLFCTGGYFSNLFADDWRQAVKPWKWSFPGDHGAHPEFRTEWWYFTGNLVGETGNPMGYQLTFFRQGVRLQPSEPNNPWSIRDLYLAHFTLTDGASRQFWYGDRISRKGPGLAGAATDGMDVWLLNWSARMRGNRILLDARHQGMALSLELAARKPLVFHGENGLSRKGTEEGQASHYFSCTELETGGFLKTPLLQAPARVQGTSWYDHEFGSNQLTPEQAGWDWFSLHLSDGHDLMIYFLRRKDGSVEPASSGTWVDPAGKGKKLALSEIRVQVLNHWKSPKSGGRYPGRWKISVPSVGMEVLFAPLVADQELTTEGSTGVTYWEGAVEGKGRSGGKEVTCKGYVEMTGYAGPIGGLF